MSIFKYEQLILETAKALQCFIEQYKRDKAKNNIELNEDKIKLITKYALLNLSEVNNQKDFNFAVESFLKDLKTDNDNKNYIRYNNTWKEIDLNTFKGKDGYSPYIQNGKWFLNGVDLGVRATGESAYEIAKRLNKPNTDTEDNWINSLKGAKGDKGEQGQKGDKGEPGGINQTIIDNINKEIEKKVNKETGKGLSSNDYTNTDKQKLDSIDLSTKLDKGTFTGTAKDLFDKLSNIETVLKSNDVNLDTLQELVDFVKVNRVLLGSIGIDNIVGLKRALEEKAPLNHTHKWADITKKPEIKKVDSKYTIEGLIGEIVVPTLPAWVGNTKPTYNWSEIIDKPSLNYLPLTGGDVNGNITSNNFIKRQSSNEKVLLGGGGDIELSGLKNENIQIGGRNLVRGTGNFEMLELPFYIQPNFGGNAGVVTETFRGNKVIKLIYNWQGFQCKTTFEDLPMIISFWVKTSKPNIQFFCSTDNTVEYVNGKNVISDGKWHKYFIRKDSNIVTANTLKKGFVEFACTTSEKHIEEVYVSSFKIEYGNKPTDWTPAPEDFDFYKGLIPFSDLETFKNRETGSYSVDVGGNWGAYINFKLSGSTSSLEFFKPDWYPTTRVGVRNSVDTSRFNDDNGKFHYLAWYEDVIRKGFVSDGGTLSQNIYSNSIIFVRSEGNFDLSVLESLTSCSLRKVFDGGSVTFSCNGKNIIYTSENQFNGKKGSTAVISIYENDCYIDIRNV